MKSIFLIAFAVASLSSTGGDIPEDRGVAGLKQVLDRLDVVGSVLHTGAHPDDENSSLLAWLSRGRGVRTAYLSATRGEGGQNLIGSELSEALGVIRTEELLAARSFDRAEQFFTPNYEFGFSKTANETLQKWGKEQLIGDVVRVIRMFRPEIIISRFSGTIRDGHGHHQAIGIATREAFSAAANPKLYLEYGKPWQAKKIYMTVRGEDDGSGSYVRVNVGEYGSAIGRSYHEIAMEGRSLHRTQSMGAPRERGPRYTYLEMIGKDIPGRNDESIFSNTTNKLMDLVELEPELESDLEALAAQILAIRLKARLDDPAEIFPELIECIGLLQKVREKAQVEHVQFILDRKASDFHLAAELAAGFTVEVLASDNNLVPGQEFELTIGVVNNGPFEFETVRINTDFPTGWEAQYIGSTGGIGPNERFEQRFTVKVSENADYTQPYWLRAPRLYDRFIWPAGDEAALPFDPPLMLTRAEISFGETSIFIDRHAEHLSIDDVYGELRNLVSVVPELSVQLSPRTAVVPLGGNRKKEFTVSLNSHFPGGGLAEVALEVPQGWIVKPKSQMVEFVREGETVSLQFWVDVPSLSGEFEVSARAKMVNKEYREGYRVINYPHIETRHIYTDARSRVNVFEIKTDVEKIGYVQGAGDEVGESLAELGIDVEFLTDDDLSRGDLSSYDAIVIGIRAYSVREALRAHNQRLLDYVEQGGTLVVQYNQYAMPNGGFGPYPFTINRPHDRVTVEEAPIIFVDPYHPVLNTPNKISSLDFEGWIQERGLYFMGEWHDQYKPILSSNDPGESSKLGGMMVAELGRGHYVYTGYAFFRQLPAGVVGAYRLFSNLISLRK